MLLTIAFVCCLNGFGQNLSVFQRFHESDEYQVVLSRKFTDSLSVAQFLNKYIAKQYANSYYEAGYDSVAFAENSVRAFATLGEKYAQCDVDISELPFSVSKKKASNLFNYDKICASVVDYYAERGYLFAYSKLDSLRFENGRVSAKLLVNKGSVVLLDSLIVKGDAKIRHSFLERTLEFKKGSVLTTNKIDRIDSRLGNISFLEQEQPFQLAFAETKADVLLFLKEKKASSFSGVLGIMPKSQTTGKLMITGDIDLKLVNVIHFGESFKLSWKKYETQNQTLNVGATFPFIFRSPVGLGAELNLEKKDSSYLRTDFMANIMVGNLIERGFSIYYRNNSSFPIGDISKDTSNCVKFNTNMVGFSAEFSSVDNVRNPYQGIIFYAKADAGQKAFVEETKTGLFQATANYDLSGFIGLYRGLSLKLRSSSYFMYSPRIFDNEFLYVGGLKTIRG
ncbi:MAG: hypothetical protein HUK15_01730, partial [Bacteroidales bacterium]|nr:hypothetical protein [Bacteroidales bacterium]